MKTLVNLFAICITVALIGCSSTQETVSPGAVSECSAKNGMACTKDGTDCCKATKCAGEQADASMGAVGEGTCTKTCGEKAADEASMGAVSEESCTKTCPMSGANMGAMSEKSECASKCSAAKAGCSKKNN